MEKGDLSVTIMEHVPISHTKKSIPCSLRENKQIEVGVIFAESIFIRKRKDLRTIKKEKAVSIMSGARSAPILQHGIELTLK